MSKLQLQLIIPDELSGKRLDKALSYLIPEYSRSRIQTWIKSGDVNINESTCSQRSEVHVGDIIMINTCINNIEKHQEEKDDPFSDYVEPPVDSGFDSDTPFDNILPFKIDPNKLN